MAQARRHYRDRDASIEHLGRHEMAKVVESEMTQPGGSSRFDEPLGHEVRRPRPGAGIVGTEDEAIVEGLHSPTG
jgi:hypothetical protein